MRLYDLLAQLAMQNPAWGMYAASRSSTQQARTADRGETADRSADGPSATDRYTPSQTCEPACYDRPKPPEAPVKTEDTAYYQREARLDYELNLRFDLGALTRTVRELSEGDIESVEQLAVAGFGLTADFEMSGWQSERTNMDVSEQDSSMVRQRSRGYSRQAAAFEAQSRGFRIRALAGEALDVRRKLDVSVQGNHRKAVNKFFLRYQMDNRFSVSFMDRFNVQTAQLADSSPESVEHYLDTAGDLAANGTSLMMAGFFDAIDSYLDQTEENLTSAVDGFLVQAAEELGFSKEAASLAREHLTASIESFFDRVDEALAELSKQFGVSEQPAAIEDAAVYGTGQQALPTVTDPLADVSEYSTVA